MANSIVTVAIPMLLAVTLVCSAEQAAFTILQIPPSFEAPNVIKVFPDRHIYAFSVRQGRMLVFDMNGRAVHDLDVLENRPLDIKYHFFDFHVDARGRIYILAVWRDAPQQTHSGLFVYNADGSFNKLLVFGKHVDGRKLLMDARGNFVVLGLNADYYFGRMTRIFLMHRYSQTGDYLGGFFEVNPADYMPPGSRAAYDPYATLRSLVDHLPVGYDGNGRVFSATPGTNDVQVFEAESLERLETISLGNPRTPDPTGMDPLPRFAGADLRLHELHMNDTSVIADFVSAAGRGHFRATYRRSDHALLSMVRITAAEGVLIQQVGIPCETAYAYSSAEQRLLSIR